MKSFFAGLDVDQARQELLLLLGLLAEREGLGLVGRVVVGAELLQADVRAVVELDSWVVPGS